MTFDEMVTDYIREYRDGVRTEMHFFEIQRSPAAAIRKAALCEQANGKRHPHQCRIPKAVLEQAEARLQAIGRRLAKAADFSAIHGLVKSEIGAIDGVGALTVYDIAHRIGVHFGKEPRLVYLHAGTRIGARALKIGGDSFDPGILPRAFSRLAPFEIEDCLCIYKDELCIGTRSRSARRKSKCAVTVRQACAWE